MKKRSFLFLGLSAFLVGGLILGCALFSESETADDLEARVQSGAPDKEGNVLVKIQIPDLTDARTLNAPVAPNLIDYYEIIFKMHGQSVYYKGTAAEGEVLVVSVKPGQKYDILLLAGDKQYKTLIASAFANMLTPLTTDGDFDPTGIGIEIKANAANVINLKPTAVKIDPETDYTITAGSDIFSPSVVRDSLVSGTDYAGIPRFTVAENNNHADSTGTHKLTVAVKTNGLLPLIQAGIAGEFTLTKAEMSLKPYSKSHPFNTQFKAISPTEIDGTPPTLTLPSSVTSGAGFVDDTPPSGFATITYEFVDDKVKSILGTLSEANPGTYGRLYFELQFYGFGDDPASKSSLWSIRNGLDPKYLDTGAGSAGGGVLVIFGDDPGDFINSEDTTIDLGPVS